MLFILKGNKTRGGFVDLRNKIISSTAALLILEGILLIVVKEGIIYRAIGLALILLGLAR